VTPQEIANKYNLRKSGNRYAGPCPQCGGSDRSDKFSIQDDGGFKCYACDFRGDAITWHRQMEGMSCPEAHEAIGKICEHTSCAVYSTCRLGDGSGKRQPPKAKSVQPISTTPSRTVRTSDVNPPAPEWIEWATEFFAKSHKELAANPEAINYLKARGVDPSVHPLGWNKHARKVNRASIGLTPERNGKTTLWIPGGIVIPNYVDGKIYSLNIRRTDQDLARFLPDRRYQFIEGGTRCPMLLHPEGLGQVNHPPSVVIVEAELDAIACHAALDTIAVVALATVQGNLTRQIEQLCQQAPIILVALDADPESNAGQKAVANWRAKWNHARYWPVPSGKDPGDYAKAGGCLATWIKAGLPAVAKTADHDQRQPALPVDAGGEGPPPQELPRHFAGTSGQGQEYIVTENKADVAALQKHYQKPVFYTAELRTLKGLEKEAAELALAVKDIFAGAEISGTRFLE